jgi:hypothetical protein
MEQLSLFRLPTRHEIPPSRRSWREGDRTVVVYMGAYCFDEDWRWWRPNLPLPTAMAI